MIFRNVPAEGFEEGFKHVIKPLIMTLTRLSTLRLTRFCAARDSRSFRQVGLEVPGGDRRCPAAENLEESLLALDGIGSGHCSTRWISGERRFGRLLFIGAQFQHAVRKVAESRTVQKSRHAQGLEH